MNQHLNFNFNCQEGSQVFNYNLSNNKQKYCVFTAAISGLLIYKSTIFWACQSIIYKFFRPNLQVCPPPWLTISPKKGNNWSWPGVSNPFPYFKTMFLQAEYFDLTNPLDFLINEHLHPREDKNKSKQFQSSRNMSVLSQSISETKRTFNSSNNHLSWKSFFYTSPFPNLKE